MRMSLKEAMEKGLINKKQYSEMNTLGKSKAKSSFSEILEKLQIAKVNITINSSGITLTSNVLPSSLNRIVNWHGTYWFKYAALWKRHVREAILECGFKNFSQERAWPVVLIERPGKALQMDYDNVIVKPIIDGFVKGGVIKDDTNEFFMCSPFTVHQKGNQNKMTVILFNSESLFLKFVQENLKTS